MLRAASTRTMMFVEGTSDEKVFVRFVDEEKCHVLICYGRDKALQAIAILEIRKFRGVLCVIDSDFSAITNQCFASANVILTDDHDLEVMLFKSGAFDLVLDELGSRAKVKRIRGGGADPREPIWKAARIVGAFRLYSEQRNLNLKFEGINFKFVDRKNLSVDTKQMIRTVYNNSKISAPVIGDVEAAIDCLRSKEHAHSLMCCGHDIAIIFGKALLSVLGSKSSTAADREVIERSLRLAYSGYHFKKTALFQKIREWEQKNKPFECLQTL